MSRLRLIKMEVVMVNTAFHGCWGCGVGQGGGSGCEREQGAR